MLNRRKVLKTMAFGVNATSSGAWLRVAPASSKRPLRVGAPFSFPATDTGAWAKKQEAPDISRNDRDYIRAIVAAVKENGLIFADVMKLTRPKELILGDEQS